VRSKEAMAFCTSVMMTAAGSLPKASRNIFTYSGSVRTISMIGAWLGSAISTGLRKGCCDWSSRSGERPSQNWLVK
jgi:hypothetical protein